MLSSAGFVVSPLPLELHEEIMLQAWRSYRRENIHLPSSHPRAQAALYITFTRVSRTWRAFSQRLVWTEVQCSDPLDFIFYANLRMKLDLRSSSNNLTSNGPMAYESARLHVSAFYLRPVDAIIRDLNHEKYPQARWLSPSKHLLFTDASALSIFIKTNDQLVDVGQWLCGTRGVTRVVILSLAPMHWTVPATMAHSWAAPIAGNLHVAEVEMHDGIGIGYLTAHVWLVFPAALRLILLAPGSLRPLVHELPAHITELVIDAPPHTALRGRASLAPWLLATALQDGLLQGARGAGCPAPRVVVRTGSLIPVGWERALGAANSRGIRLEHICKYP
jgi:hypothetical protein